MQIEVPLNNESAEYNEHADPSLCIPSIKLNSNVVDMRTTHAVLTIRQAFSFHWYAIYFSTADTSLCPGSTAHALTCLDSWRWLLEYVLACCDLCWVLCRDNKAVLTPLDEAYALRPHLAHMASAHSEADAKAKAAAEEEEDEKASEPQPVKVRCLPVSACNSCCASLATAKQRIFRTKLKGSVHKEPNTWRLRTSQT